MFIDLLKDIAASEGLDLQNTSQKTLGIVRANQAAQELYESTDLFDSLKEVVVDSNIGENQIALPWFVEHVRGMRYYDSRISINSEDIKNRYGAGLGNEVWYLTFRRKETSVLFRELANESILTFTIPKAESEDIVINIQGPTDLAAQAKETVTIPAGLLEASCVGNFKSPLKSLTKTKSNNYDITITDVDDNEVGIFPNCLTRLFYNVFQFMDTTSPGNATSFSALEVLFKPKYVPMIDDVDEFMCGQRYEKAIYWKYMEHRAKTTDDAISNQTKCNQVLQQIEADSKGGTRERINFVPSPYFNIPYYKLGHYYGIGYLGYQSRR